MATIQDLGKVAYLNKGNYDENTNYEINDVVSYNGSSYVSLVNDNKGNIPTNINFWSVVAQSAYEIAVQNGYEGTAEEWTQQFLNADNYYNKTEVDTKLKKKVYYFDTVALMKSSTDLTEGDMVITKGYYSANDGGTGEYEIVNDNTLTDDGGSVHDLANGLKAKLIIKEALNPIQFGAYGDGVHDDITALNSCRDLCIDKNILMTANSNNIFGISSGFTILAGCSIEFNNATIKALNTMDYAVRQHKTRTTDEVVTSEYVRNIVIECNSKANYGFYQDALGWSALTENIRVHNHLLIGIYIETGQIRLHNAKVEQDDDIESVGLQVNSTDSEYYNITTRDCSTGIKVTSSSNGFYECHPVMFNTSLLTNSIAFDVNDWNIFIHPICDTFKYGFYIRHYGGCSIIGAQFIINSTYYNDNTMADNPYFLYFTTSDNSASTRMNVIDTRLPSSAIINSLGCYFANIEQWLSGNLLLNNPTVSYNKSVIQNIPKEIYQYHQNYDLLSYVANDVTFNKAVAYLNGNIIEYRLNEIVLPAISKGNSKNIFSSMPTSLIPSINKYNNVITSNGVVLQIYFDLTNHSIMVKALSGSVTSGDSFSFTNCFIK